MRLIDGDHLEQWIVARWEESPTTPYPLKAVEILKQIEREPIFDADKTIRDAYKHGKSEGIKRGLAMQSSRWIPCSERLPENGLYLITGKKGSVYPLKIEDGRWYGGIKPVAWMPLPKAYKGEEE